LKRGIKSVDSNIANIVASIEHVGEWLIKEKENRLKTWLGSMNDGMKDGPSQGKEI